MQPPDIHSLSNRASLVALLPDHGYGWAVPGGGRVYDQAEAERLVEKLDREMRR